MQYTALNIFRKLDAEIDSSNIEDSHLLPSKEPECVIIKFSKRKDSNRIRYYKKNLKRMDLTSFAISSPVFINDRVLLVLQDALVKTPKLVTIH